MGLFTNFRFYVGMRRDLHSIAKSLERLANHAEGRPITPEDLPEAERGSPALDVAYTSDKDFSRIYNVETRLTATLGRQPTPEEIIQAIEDEDSELTVEKQ